MTTSSLTMDMSIVSVGVDYLKLARQNNELGYFSGFRFGASNDLTISEDLTNVGGTVTYMGNASEMTYTKVNTHEILLRATLGHNRGNFDIGSFAFLVGPSNIPFFVGKFPYIHKKMATTGVQLGGIFTLQIKFKMYGLDTHWTFANMAASYAQADTSQVDVLNIPDTFVESSGYLLQIDEPYHLSNRKGYFLYPGYKGLSWRAPDIQTQHSSPNFWKLNGGSDGDGHLY